MIPEANDDFVDVVSALAAEQCDFVIVGAYALAAHGAPRATGDLGRQPRRIDVLTELSGVTFDEATADAVVGHLGAQEVRCIGLDAMIKNKRAAGRTKDLADAELLEEIRARRLAGRGV